VDRNRESDNWICAITAETSCIKMRLVNLEAGSNRLVFSLRLMKKERRNGSFGVMSATNNLH
jgi:hypothetical protein